MNNEQITLELKNKMVVLKLTNFDTDISADDLTNIQHHNIIGEILTFPVIMNRVGNLRADIEQVLAETKLDFEIFQAYKQEEKRKSLTFEVLDSKGKAKMDKPTKDEVENAVLIDPEFKIKKLNLIRIQRNVAYVESLYWAANDKSKKLDILSAKMKPEDFEGEILEGSINGVMILVRDKTIK